MIRHVTETWSPGLLPMKTQGIKRMILFIVELFADVQCFGIYIKPTSEQLTYDNVYSEFYLMLQ